MARYFWLVVVFALAVVLRVWNLASLPLGFTPDEAAFGYNAYSLLKTGRDEWATAFYQLPITNLQSFGDYKLPLYAFLTVPSVAIFGINEFATRLPNAIFGSLAVLVIYILSRRLFNPKIALASASLLAVSSWHVSMSRGAFEANLITLLVPLFLALYLSQKYLLATLVLALNFYSYHSARYISLLLLLFFLLKAKSYRLLSVLLVLPGLLGMFGSSNSRAADVSILSPTDGWQSVADSRFSAVQSGLPDPIARIFYNKAVYIFSQFTKNYLSYFSPEYLFTKGVGETTYGMFPGIGALYPIEFFFLLTAMIFVIKNPNKKIIFVLILLSLMPLPAALAKGVGYAGNRSVGMIPFLSIISAVGFVQLSKYIPKLLLLFLYFPAVLFFAVNYIYHARDLAPGMLYGRKEAVLRVANLSKDYNHIFVSRSLSEPHIYVAFYNQIDPRFYQKNSSFWQQYKTKYKFLDQYEGYSLGKYTFGSLKFNQTNSLYVGLPQDFSDSQTPMFTIDYPDGRPAILVSRL